uniref:Zinc-binding loop region of homing endonuclease domain-containing protein n=1 Tax=viral metagenome TaxID=1070528 RepID=A0A6C0C8W8_9ZZZZ
MDHDEKFFNEIQKKCTAHGDCSIWNGTFRDGLCFQWNRTVSRPINVLKFMWNYYYEPIKANEKLIRTCGEPLCIQIEHIDVKPRAKLVSKEEKWNKLFKCGKIDETSEYDGKKCLVWQGYKSVGGYGESSVNHKKYYVHRIAFWISHDEYETIDDIPDVDDDGQRLVVRHLCGQSSCFESSHLQIGTDSVNSYEDKINAGTMQRGEKHHNCSISEELAKKIKWSKLDRSDKNYMTAKERAVHFGVSFRIVDKIDNNETWSHIPDKNGIILSTARKRERERNAKIKAKNRKWTEKMFKQARWKLDARSKIDRNGRKYKNSFCRLWTGKCAPDGYARTMIHGKQIFVHILACHIKYRTTNSGGLQVLHKCGRRLCVNPKHLSFGSAIENAADKKMHGTSGRKLTMEQANEIRLLYKSGDYKQIDLTKKYNVSKDTIQNIIHNRTYVD